MDDDLFTFTQSFSGRIKMRIPGFGFYSSAVWAKPHHLALPLSSEFGTRDEVSMKDQSLLYPHTPQESSCFVFHNSISCSRLREGGGGWAEPWEAAEPCHGSAGLPA